MSSFIPNNEHFLKRARNIRNELLNKTDKYILSDYRIKLEKQMAMKFIDKIYEILSIVMK